MKIMPEWWHSVRSLVTLSLTAGFLVICAAPVLWGIDVKAEVLTPFLSVYIVTLNYYFKDKKRDNGEIK